MQPPGSGGLVSLINDQNTSANVNFAGLSVPNPAGLEMQLVLNSLYLDFSFFLSFFEFPRMNRGAAQCFGPLSNPQHPTPNPLTQMSAQKTVAFTKTLKKKRKVLRTERKRATTGDRGGICWCCIKCNAEVFEPRRGQVFGPSVFLLILLSPSQTTKAPLRRTLPFFFLLGRSTQSFLYYAATVQSWGTPAVVLVHLCNTCTFSFFQLSSYWAAEVPPSTRKLWPVSVVSWAECLTLCWIFTWPLTESFSRHRCCCWTPGFRCSCMSQHKLAKPQSQTLTRQEGESLPRGRSALIPEHGTSSLLELSLDASDGGALRRHACLASCRCALFAF